MRTGRIAATSLLALAASLALASPAPGAPGKLVFDGCQTSSLNSPVPGCDQLEGLGATGALAFSADGLSAYAALEDGIGVFRRDRISGALSFQECFDATGTPPCTQIPGILGVADDIAVTLDGRSVYAAGGRRQTLIGFRRDPQTGSLTFSSCRYSSYGDVGDLPGCPVGEFEEATQVEASPDGRAVYIQDRGCADNTGDCFVSVVSYERDPATSLLGQASRGPSTSGSGLFALSRGRSIYQLDSETGTLITLKRVGAAGLKETQCLTRRGRGSCGRVRALRRPSALAVSPDGRRLVVALRPGKLAIFRRSPRSGRISLRRVIHPVHGRVRQLEFSGSGRSLFAVVKLDGDQLLIRLKVGRKNGRIAYAQCLIAVGYRGCDGLPKVGALTELAQCGGLVYAITQRNDWAGSTLVRFRPQPNG